MKYQSVLGKTIELTAERKLHIINKHPELKPHFGKIYEILSAPDTIKISKIDKKALLFYKYYDTIREGKYINVTVKINQRNFILTAYITDRIRAGETYEAEKETT